MSKGRKKRASASGKISDSVRLVTGCFFVLAGIYTLVALGSYLVSWSIDQSLLSEKNILNNLSPVENIGGKAGFLWADLLVGKLFGIGAFIIPFFFIGVAFLCFKIKRIRIVPFFLLSAFGCVIVSVACAFLFGFTPWKHLFSSGAGGAYGHYANQWLVNVLGRTGTGLLILFVLVLWIVLSSSRFVRWCFSRGKRPEDSLPKLLAAGKSETGTSSGTSSGPSSGPSTDIPADTPTDSTQDAESSDQPVFEIQSPEAETSRSDFKVPETILEEVPDDIPAGSLSMIYDPKLDLPAYRLPGFDLLEDYRDKIHSVSREEWERNNKRIQDTLKEYKITIEKILAVPGPTVTLYKIVLSPGIRISQIKRLEDDIAMSLAARGVRVIAPIPGTNAVGIEVANEKPTLVSMYSVLDSQKFKEARYDLPVALGKTISNEVYTLDLAKMPHLLVAGATGQGKSVGLNVIITSLLYKMHPAYLKFVLVDPKKVELSLYSKLEKHFLAKLPGDEDAIITDTKKVVNTLRSLCTEMDDRYNLLRLAHVRNIKEYNAKFLSRRLNPLKGHRFMPFIVVIVDEFSDLIITAGRDVEEPLTRLAQLARAIGIHLIIATQRPTTNIITGTIKANFPARMAYRVISNVDSRTILDQPGANQLIGKGDMLIYTGSELARVQCAFIDTPEIERVVDFISRQPGYDQAYSLPEYIDNNADSGASSGSDNILRDENFAEAARLIVRYNQGSTSLIQRKMNLGYNRAGRIMDQLEALGIVGPLEGSKARQVLVTPDTLEQILKDLGL